MILHLPHASTLIPAPERAKLLLSDDDLQRELLRMTDWYADELFDLGAEATRLLFPVSRLVVDPERFADDDAEPMAASGMGVIYTSTSDGRPLRYPVNAAESERLLQVYYYPHHQALQRLVEAAPADQGRRLLIDAHTFPSSPLPCDLDQSPLRPDICLGTDPYHTPEWLEQQATVAFQDLGWSVAVNRPYSGTIVPRGHCRQDARVYSLMIEVNRALYLDEVTGARLPQFRRIARTVQRALRALAKARPLG